jgi:hypothetical protein
LVLLHDYLLSKYGKVENAGSYGDVYGSVTALFTSLAFALLIYTALMQKEELKLQRSELKSTRKELKRSANSQEKSQADLAKQLKTMNKSAVLNGYSALLNYHDNRRKDLANLGNSGKSADHHEKALHARRANR